MNGWSSSPQRLTAEGDLRPENASKAGARCATVVRIAVVLGVLAASGALASDSVSVALNVMVVPVCRFLTSTSTVGATDSGRSRGRPTTGSATLTYACSNGTAAAFTFAVPAATNVACTACSGLPFAMGTILATDLGTGQGLGSGRDRTLTVSTPFVHAAYEDAAPAGGYSDMIIVTVSP